MKAVEQALDHAPSTWGCTLHLPISDPTIMSELEAFESLITTVPLRTGLTPATILGPWISALIPLGAIGALTALGILHRIRNHSSV